MTKDELKKAAIRAGLQGGRKFGSREHKVLMQHIASEMLANAKDRAFLSMAVDAIVELANQSALQQSLARPGVNLIDRKDRKAARTSLFTELAVEQKKG